MINPKHLRAFHSVAHTGGVGKSAEELGRAQSAVSRCIRELETGLGAPLFERRPHGMRLTAFGRLLRERVDKAFAEMDEARQRLDRLASGPCNPRAPVFHLGLSAQRLLAFAETMEERHMGVAAERLGISQPAVSQAVREIELGLGLPLLTRTATGIAPNAAGLALAIHMRRALSELRKAERELAALQGGIGGHVTVGTLSLARNLLLPRAIIELLAARPAITVSTVEGAFEHLAALLHAGELDFLVGGLRPSGHTIGLAVETILEDTLAIIVRADHPLTRRASLDFPDLAAARWVLPPPATSTRTTMDSSLRKRGLDPPLPVVETADVAITGALLMESDLVTANSPHLFQREIGAGALCILPLALPVASRGVGILRRTDSQPSVAAELLMARLRAAAS